MWVLKVAIGSEPMQRIPAIVLKDSIRRHTQVPVRFYESWTPETGWHPLMERAGRIAGTEFALWRWLAPSVMGREDWGIYLDSDQAVFADPAELVAYLTPGATIACVRGAEGHFGAKLPDPEAIETSVMVYALPRVEWDPWTLFERVKTKTMRTYCAKRVPGGRLAPTDYSCLQQACFLRGDEVAELPRPWNHFNIHEPGRTKLTHWSHVRSQPYRNPDHPTAHVFRDLLRKSLEEGTVTPEVLGAEIDAGNIHPSYGRSEATP